MTPMRILILPMPIDDKNAREDAERNNYPTSAITCPTAPIPHYI